MVNVVRLCPTIYHHYRHRMSSINMLLPFVCLLVAKADNSVYTSFTLSLSAFSLITEAAPCLLGSDLYHVCKLNTMVLFCLTLNIHYSECDSTFFYRINPYQKPTNWINTVMQIILVYFLPIQLVLVETSPQI